MNCLLTNLFCSGFEPQQYHSDLTRSWHIQFCLILVHIYIYIFLQQALACRLFPTKFLCVSSFLRFSCAFFIIHFSHSKVNFSCRGSYSQCCSSANEKNDSHEQACLLAYIFRLRDFEYFPSNHEISVPRACRNQVMKGPPM